MGNMWVRAKIPISVSPPGPSGHAGVVLKVTMMLSAGSESEERSLMKWRNAVEKSSLMLSIQKRKQLGNDGNICRGCPMIH